MSEGGQGQGHGHGLRDEYPRRTGAGAAVGLGIVWGVLGYTVLWDGSPFSVTRAFVQSLPGTVLLLPVRIVLWAIRGVERATGRTFDFSDDHAWIAVAASAVGALIVAGVFLAARTAVGRMRARR